MLINLDNIKRKLAKTRKTNQEAKRNDLKLKIIVGEEIKFSCDVIRNGTLCSGDWI